MNLLILNGGPLDGRGARCRSIAAAVARRASARGWVTDVFDLAEMTIKPCRACFACWLKHPGRCAIQDDEGPIIKAMAWGDVLAWTTPVTFGGYGPELKRALDRCLPVLLPFFIKRGGEVHHPLRYERRRRLLVFGTLDRSDPEAERVFRALVQRNALNLDAVMAESRVFVDGDGDEKIEAAIRGLLSAAEEAP